MVYVVTFPISSTSSFYSSTPKLGEKYPLTARRIQYNQLDTKVKILVDKAENREIKLFKSLESTEITPDVGIFALEKDGSGKRTFVRVALQEAYDLIKYRREPHVYEVIPEAAPCHLYFDVEFMFEEKPDLDGNAVIAELVQTVNDKMKSVFDKEVYDLIHLDATSDKKFSRHLIFRGNGFCFRNNEQAGAFVRREILCFDKFAEVVDAGVYSKNRNFRCIWSTKFANGGKFPLRPYDGTNRTAAESTLEYFKSTLVTHIDPDCERIGFVAPSEKPVTPGNVMFPNLARVDVKCTGIDAYALSVFAPNGTIKSQMYSKDFDTLTLVVSGCRFCHRIGREHKSNSIYLVCRLSSGVIVQKCFDPDCRGFESAPVEIPPKILENTRQIFPKKPTNNVDAASTKTPQFKYLLTSSSDDESMDFDY